LGPGLFALPAHFDIRHNGFDHQSSVAAAADRDGLEHKAALFDSDPRDRSHRFASRPDCHRRTAEAGGSDAFLKQCSSYKVVVNKALQNETIITIIFTIKISENNRD